MKKCVLSIVLAVILILGIMPVKSFAVELPEKITVTQDTGISPCKLDSSGTAYLMGLSTYSWRTTGFYIKIC